MYSYFEDTTPVWVLGLLLALPAASQDRGADQDRSPASEAVEPKGRKAALLGASDEFYDSQAVQTIHLEIRPEDLQRLNQALPQRITVRGAFRWEGRTFEPVGIRYKGNSSSNPEAGHKRSLLVSFAEFVSGQRFLGLRHVALDNGIQFGSLFSEPLITEALRASGVKAARCNYARVYLNGAFAGVYVNVERIDRSFLARNFGNDQGILFKVDEGGPGADLRQIGDDPALYAKTFELHAGDREKGFRGLLELVRTLNDPRTGEARLREVFDYDGFLAATAVLLFSGAFDQYTGWGPHNFYLYRNPSDHRWTYIPWDLDVGFADNAFGRIPVLDDWHAAWPAPVPGRPLMEQLIAKTNLLNQYREKAAVILEQQFRPEIIGAKLAALYAQIKPDLAQDPFPPRRVTVPSDSSYADIIASMEAFMRKRYTLARAQLDHPGERPRFKAASPSPEEHEPRPGPDSSDAPRDLRALKVTASEVELQWTDHAQGEVAFVVQRCLGRNSTNFVNFIGQGGADITRAVDHHVEAGQTYRYRVYAVLPTPTGPRGTGVSNTITIEVPGAR